VELLNRQAPLTSIAATALAEVLEVAVDADDRGDAVFRRGRGGTAVGRAVHAVLQSVDLKTGSNVRRLATAEAAAEAIPARATEVAELASAAIRSDEVRKAVASGRYWREVFVSALSGDVLVEGFIDLLYDSPHGLVIVDYKTDALAGDIGIASAMGHYRLQGAAYAFALQRNLGRPVAACRFLFLRTPGTPTVEIEDLAGAIVEVEARVAAMAAGALVHSGDAGRGMHN
jgi:ATP-dependent helicase/nuclease subunit A